MWKLHANKSQTCVKNCFSCCLNNKKSSTDNVTSNHAKLTEEEIGTKTSLSIVDNQPSKIEAIEEIVQSSKEVENHKEIQPETTSEGNNSDEEKKVRLFHELKRHSKIFRTDSEVVLNRDKLDNDHLNNIKNHKLTYKSDEDEDYEHIENTINNVVTLD